MPREGPSRTIRLAASLGDVHILEGLIPVGVMAPMMKRITPTVTVGINLGLRV
jgi:hypothetical protein